MPGDCCECGACCFSQSEQYVPLTLQDEERLGTLHTDAVVEIGQRPYLRMENGHCAQLRHLEGDWVCRIYPQRPQVCRSLARGSPSCLEERREKRLFVLQRTKTLAP